MPPSSPDLPEELRRQELLHGQRIAWIFRWYFLGLVQALAWVVWLVQEDLVGLWGILLSGTCLGYNLMLTRFLRQRRTDPWIRYTSMALDILFLTTYNALDAHFNSPLVPVTTATLLVYPILLFVASLHLDRWLILFSTLLTALAMNLLFWVQQPRFDVSISSQLVCADPLGQGYRTAYLVLFGLLLLIIPSTINRLLRAQRDIHDRSRRHERLALQDPVTGLANHRHLEAFLTQALRSAQADGSLVAVVSLSLEGFHAQQKLLGRATAEFILIETARRLEMELGSTDLAARLSDDVFVVVLQGPPDRDAAELRLRQIQDRLARPLPLSRHPTPLETRLGVAMTPEDDGDPANLLRLADQRMVAARQQQERAPRMDG